MIYLEGKGIKVLILETANLEELKKGRPAKSPDGSVVVAWTPAPQWLAEQIDKTQGDAKAIAALIDESAKMPQEPDRPRHEPKERRFGR